MQKILFQTNGQTNKAIIHNAFIQDACVYDARVYDAYIYDCGSCSFAWM